MSEHLSTPDEDPILIDGQTPEDWITHLTFDHRTGEYAGHLATPGSRYGRTSAEVAPWAVAALIVYEAFMGEPDDSEAFIDHAMGLLVNDDSEMHSFVIRHAMFLPPEVLEKLTIDGEPLYE